jgi:hypothetical protein
MARFNKMFTKKLYMPDSKNKGQLDKMTRVTASASELNKMDGVTATAAELNLVDGASVANDVASKAVILDAGGNIVAGANNGTPNTGVTAYEYGNGINHVTRLTFTALTLPNADGAAAKGMGVLLYTFPATGDIIVHNGTYDAYVTIDGAGNSVKTPEFGLGSVIATGLVSDLGTPATFENLMVGTAGTADGSTATELTLNATAGIPLILAKGVNKMHFNIADTWAAASTATSVTGTVFIEWSIRVI